MSTFSVLEYMYRDAGNWKAYGAVLLAGQSDGALDQLRPCLDWGDQFVAEQVGVPSLCAQHFASSGDGPSDLDHAFHELVDLRAATEAEAAELKQEA